MKKIYPKILLSVFLLTVIFSPVFGVYKADAQTVPLTGQTDTGGFDFGNPSPGPATVPANYVEQNPAQVPANTVTQDANSPGAVKADESSKREAPKPPVNAWCIDTSFPFFHFDACAAMVVNFLMWIVSWFLYLAGFIFDQSMQFTLNITELMKSVPVVDIGWKIFRDLANVFFIFILLWIAMSTILGFNSGKTKELIVHLVVVALLMNFSLFITKTIIDGSNIIALHFYNLIVTSPTTGTNQLTSLQGSMSGAFMEGLKIQTLYDSKGIGEPDKPRSLWDRAMGAAERVGNAAINTVGATAMGGPVAGVVAGAATLMGGNVINWGKIILIGVFGSALMLIAAYVFLVGAVLMLIRAIVLMFVMMLSPLAFLAFAMPFAEKFVEPWKEALIKQCIFAPAFMTLSYVVVKTIQSPAFKGVTSITMGEASFATAFTSGAGEGITLIINFLLVIGLMLGCILVAKKLEVHGLEFAKAVGAKGAMWVASGRFITTTAGVVGYGFKGAGRVASASAQGFKGVGEMWKNKGQLGGKITEGLKNIKDTAVKMPGQLGTKAKAGFEATKQFVNEPGKWQEKTSAFGAAINTKADSMKKIVDVNELDKKFKRSGFGATELGNLIREQTTERATHAKFGGEKSMHESYEESEKLRSKQFALENLKYAENSLALLHDAEAKRLASMPNWQDKKYKDASGVFDQAKFEADFQKFTETFRPQAKDYTTPAEFQTAMNDFNALLALQTHRSDHPVGVAGDAAFATEQKDYNERWEKPNRRHFAPNAAGDAAFARMNKIYNDRDLRRDAAEKEVKKQEGALGSNLNKITAEQFADLDEHTIMEMAPYANLKQLKAVMASEHWTQQEKTEMLEGRWSKEVNGFEKFSEEVMKPYKEALDELHKAMVAQEIETDEGAIQEKRDDGTDQIITNPTDGKKYVKLRSGGQLLLPDEPQLPGNLKGWARNKMTKEEYELASLVSPDLFNNHDLVHTIRWSLTNKEFRTDENMDYNLRDRLTYIKDSGLDTVVKGANHPNYIAEDSEQTRKNAFTAAEAAVAAEKIRNPRADAKTLDKIFRKIYSRLTANDTIRRNISIDWANGRAPNEIVGARSRNRGSVAVHRLVDAGIAQHFKDKDSEDITLLLEHVLTDYKAEREGKGIVTKENRDLIRYLFTDKNSKSLARPIAKLDAELQTIYRELEATGNYDPARAGDIKYRSDTV